MKPIPIEYCRGERCFIRNGNPSNLTLLDFWAWAFSDVVSNTSRGMLAEFIVATALGLDIKEPRDGWAKFDLKYRGKGIEVKSAAYHQRWYQKQMSKISFSCPKTKAWDPETNRLEPVSKRQADIYVLCLLSEKNRDAVNPLNIEQWRFWVIDVTFFNKRQRSQHSITYNSLINEVGEPIGYDDIKARVDSLIAWK